MGKDLYLPEQDCFHVHTSVSLDRLCSLPGMSSLVSPLVQACSPSGHWLKIPRFLHRDIGISFLELGFHEVQISIIYHNVLQTSLDLPPPILDCEDKVEWDLGILLTSIPSTPKPLHNASQMNTCLTGAQGSSVVWRKEKLNSSSLLLLHLPLMKDFFPTGGLNGPGVVV